MLRYSDCPQTLREFLIYHENIKGQSQLTISEYYLDLRMFLRFIKLMRSDMPIHSNLDDISIKDIDIAFKPIDIKTTDLPLDNQLYYFTDWNKVDDTFI